jgi:hypothetical protein
MSDYCTLLRRMAGFAADAFDQEKQNTEASAVASDLKTLSHILQASPPIFTKALPGKIQSCRDEPLTKSNSSSSSEARHERPLPRSGLAA